MLVLLWISLAVAAPGHESDPDGAPARFTESLKSFLRCTSLGDVVAANDGKLPRSVKEWVTALERFGRVVPAYMPFSRSPNHASLAAPRIVLTVENRFDKEGVKRARGRPNVMDQLFVALSFNEDGTQTVEFITQRARPSGLRFGVVHDYRTPAKATFEGHEGATGNCFTCHKNQGPIFPAAPWSDSDQFLATRVAMLERLHEADPKAYGAAHRELTALKEKAKDAKELAGLIKGSAVLKAQPLVVKGEDTGLKLFGSDPGSVDSRVRSAAQYHFLRGEPKAAEAAIRDFTAELLRRDDLIQVGLGKEYLGLLEAADGKSPKAGTSFLKDFDPIAGRARDPDSDDEPALFDPKIVAFDRLPREKRKAAVPAELIPSAKGALEGDTARRPSFSNKNNILVADGIHYLLQLTAEDREIVAKARTAAGGQWKEIAAEVLADKGWNGIRPDREAYLAVLKPALETAFRKRKLATDFLSFKSFPCEEEEGSVSAPQGSTDLVPSRCDQCHRTTGTARFPFDPENRELWREWFRDPEKRKVAESWRMKILARLASEKNPMPPTDSDEAKRFGATERREMESFLKGLK